MKTRGWLTLVAGLTTFALVGQASGATCRPIKAKTWKGNVTLTKPVGGFANATALYFEQNGCKWGDHPEMNGVDAVVFDMSGYGSLPITVSSTTASPIKHRGVGGFFLDSGCARLAASDFQSAGTAATKLTVPTTGRWLVVEVSPVATALAKDVAITVSSPGKTCPKRKRRR